VSSAATARLRWTIQHQASSTPAIDRSQQRPVGLHNSPDRALTFRRRLAAESRLPPCDGRGETAFDLEAEL
jgi:hypothetical protein